MTTLFEGTIDVDHRFLFLARDSDLADGFGRAGQQNGLCGAGVAGQVSMTTGLHLGEVRVSIEWYADQPPVDDTWEEIVEVSYDVPTTDLLLTALEDHRKLSVPATGPHRL